MNPDQQDYQFILDQGKPSKKIGLPPTSSPWQRMIIVIAGGLLLLTLIITAWVVISSLGKVNHQDLVSVGRTEQKILFISGLALASSKSSDTLTLASTVNSAVGSNNYSLQTYLTGAGQKNLIKQIGTGEDTELEAAFDAAAKSGSIDELYLNTLDELLATYSSELKTAYADTGEDNEKKLLEAAADDVAQLQAARNQ